jgi:hypothetical protein
MTDPDNLHISQRHISENKHINPMENKEPTVKDHINNINNQIPLSLWLKLLDNIHKRANMAFLRDTDFLRQLLIFFLDNKPAFQRNFHLQTLLTIPEISIAQQIIGLSLGIMLSIIILVQAIVLTVYVLVLRSLQRSFSLFFLKCFGLFLFFDSCLFGNLVL